jgi:uncharacterized protein involved in type VI secretion and phage assembly
MSQYYGKYRGKVENNVDPMMLGRIQVSCPAVLGDGTPNWAMPCAPYAGSGVGLFAIPPVGANVWVEFEAGELDHPIWSGCFWGKGEVPTSPPLAQVKILKTDAATITLDDQPGIGGITLALKSGQKIVMNARGIEIDNGMGAVIKMAGPQVTVNNGALDVI